MSAESLSLHGGFAIHCVRCDATNARIWQRRKLHVMEGDSFICPNYGGGGGAGVNEALDAAEGDDGGDDDLDPSLLE